MRELSLYEHDDKNLVQDSVMALAIAVQDVHQAKPGIYLL
jgi:hypothetical protein